MNYWSLILIFLVFSSTGVASVPPRYHVRPDDVEAWLQQAIRQSPEETLSALSELQRWKNSSAFTRWQNHSLSPVEIYLPTNSTTDTCYIIRLKEDTPQVFIKFIQETALKLHGEIRSYYEKLFKGLVVCFKNASEDAIESMKELPWIQYIERDCIIWSGQVQKRAPWGLSRISQPRKPLNYQFGFDQTGNGVDVYVLDSGIFSDHPEFGGRAKLLYNAIDRVENTERASSKDCSGHGTEVASIIAGKWTGVAKKANIKAIQVLGCNGNGRNSDLIHALEWMSTHRTGPSIIHLSVGGPKSRALDEVVASMTAGQIPVIVAAGNADQDACQYSPGGSLKAITVGAITENDKRADYSNFGICLNIFAPGDNILAATQPSTEKIAKHPPLQLAKTTTMVTTIQGKDIGDLESLNENSSPPNLDGDDDMNPLELGYNEGYIISSGTSMAAPFVTGVFALLMEKYPHKTASELWTVVQSLSLDNVLDPSSMKGSPNVLLQTPKYDIRSNQILIPDLNEPLEEDGDVEGTSFLNGISLKIALFVLFLFLALLVLFSCILFWGLRARRLRARTVREHRSDEDLLENSQIDGPVVKSPLMKREQDDNITDNRTGDHHGFQFPHFSTFLRLKIDPREMQEIKPTSPTLTV